MDTQLKLIMTVTGETQKDQPGSVCRGLRGSVITTLDISGHRTDSAQADSGGR